MISKQGLAGLLAVLTVAVWTGSGHSANSAGKRKTRGPLPATPAGTALARTQPVGYYSSYSYRYPRKYRRHRRRHHRPYYYGRYDYPRSWYYYPRYRHRRHHRPYYYGHYRYFYY